MITHALFLYYHVQIFWSMVVENLFKTTKDMLKFFQKLCIFLQKNF